MIDVEPKQTMSLRSATKSSAVSGALFVFLVVNLAGCIPDLPQGDHRVANRAIHDTFEGTSSGGEDTANAESEAELPPSSANVAWHDFFSDPQLVALIEEALENNQEIALARQESFITSFEVMARRGEILPHVGAVIDGGFDRVGLHTSQGRDDESAGLEQNLGDFSIGLVASWEVDVWRRLRNLRDAAAQRYLSSVEARRFLETQLISEIASLYYELMAYDQKLAVVTHTVEVQQAALDAVHLQFEAADTTLLAVRRFEAELLEFQGRQYRIRQAIVETENRLNFLVGRFPRHVERATDTFMDLTPPAVATGTPSDILVNRPDVRAAELAMQASDLDIAAARARYFPSLSFEAGVGYNSFDIVRLFQTPASIFANFFGNIAAPLFNRRGITAGYFAADARQRAAVIQYERAILSAYVEVVNRLNRVQNLQSSYEVRAEQVDRLADAIEAANSLFMSAEADYLEVLTARRESLNAQMELIELKEQQLSASVSLYQALGGGWDREEEVEEP